MLTAIGLSVSIGQRTLLDAIDLAVAPGEMVAILGENGAGKSTLLSRLAGDAQPRTLRVRGEVHLAGRLIAAWSMRERARLRAVVPQQAQAGFAFTAFELTLLGRHPHGQSRETDTAIAHAALALAHADHLAPQSADTLSGGERARVALAAAFAQLWESDCAQPRYLLLDEPTAALDLAHQHRLLETARSFAVARDIGIVAILHDLNLAALYADRVGILRGGRLLALGSTADVLHGAQIERGFSVAAQVIAHPLRSAPLIATASLSSTGNRMDRAGR